MRDQMETCRPLQQAWVKKAVVLMLSMMLLLPWTIGLASDTYEPVKDWREKFAAEDIPLGEFLEWTAQQEKSYGQNLKNWPSESIASYQAQLAKHLSERQGITDRSAFKQRVRSFALDEKVLLVNTVNFLFEHWMRAPYTVQAQYTWLVVTYSLAEPKEIMIFPNDDEIKESVAIAAAQKFVSENLHLTKEALKDYTFLTSFVDDEEEYGRRVWLIQASLPGEAAMYLVIDGKTGDVMKNTLIPGAW